MTSFSDAGPRFVASAAKTAPITVILRFLLIFCISPKEPTLYITHSTENASSRLAFSRKIDILALAFFKTYVPARP